MSDSQFPDPTIAITNSPPARKPARPGRPLSEADTLVHDLQSGSQMLDEIARRITEQLETFENWANALTGKVEAIIWIPDSEYPGESVFDGIRYHRTPKGWIISYAWRHPGLDPNEVEWKPVKESALAVRKLAIEHIPDLMRAMHTEQQRIVQELQESSNGFDLWTQVFRASVERTKSTDQGGK
jgi:hypothetical protein